MRIKTAPYPEPVAWKVTTSHGDCYTFAKTGPAARWNAVKALREAGYCHKGQWPMSVRSYRAESFDKSPLREGAGRKVFGWDTMCGR